MEFFIRHVDHHHHYKFHLIRQPQGWKKVKDKTRETSLTLPSNKTFPDMPIWGKCYVCGDEKPKFSFPTDPEKLLRWCILLKCQVAGNLRLLRVCWSYRHQFSGANQDSDVT